MLSCQIIDILEALRVIQSFCFLVASYILIVVLHEFGMLQQHSHCASRNNRLILTSPKSSISGLQLKHGLESTVLDAARPMVHTVSDVRGKESEVVESGAVQTDGGGVIGLQLMLALALFAEQKRGFVECADEMGW